MIYGTGSVYAVNLGLCCEVVRVYQPSGITRIWMEPEVFSFVQCKTSGNHFSVRGIKSDL